MQMQKLNKEIKTEKPERGSPSGLARERERDQYAYAKDIKIENFIEEGKLTRELKALETLLT